MWLWLPRDWDRLRQELAEERLEVEPGPVPLVVPVDIVVEGGVAERVYGFVRVVMSLHVLGAVIQNDMDDVSVVTAVHVGEPVRVDALRRGGKLDNPRGV